MAEPIDVSAEELRFLRRSFRRFALPYLLGGIAVAVAGLVLGGARAPAGDSSEPAVQGLIAEAAALREALGEVRDALEAADARTREHGGRLDGLDRRIARLAQDVAEGPSASAGTDPALRQRLAETQERLRALEARVVEAERHRRNALAVQEDADAGPPASASDGDPVDWRSAPGR